MYTPDEGSIVSRWTRGCVYAFLLVFAVTGLAHLELFPFSAFRLFSEVRHAERQSWQLRAVDANGIEMQIHLSKLPRGIRHTTDLLGDFDDLSAAARDEICDAWTQPMRDDGAEVSVVRVYNVVIHVRPGGPPPRRSMAYECGGRA